MTITQQPTRCVCTSTWDVLQRFEPSNHLPNGSNGKRAKIITIQDSAGSDDDNGDNNGASNVRLCLCSADCHSLLYWCDCYWMHWIKRNPHCVELTHWSQMLSRSPIRSDYIFSSELFLFLSVFLIINGLCHMSRYRLLISMFNMHVLRNRSLFH